MRRIVSVQTTRQEGIRATAVHFTSSAHYFLRAASLRNGMSHVESLGFWAAEKEKEKKQRRRSSGSLVNKLCLEDLHIAGVNYRLLLISWTGGLLREQGGCETGKRMESERFSGIRLRFLLLWKKNGDQLYEDNKPRSTDTAL